MQKKTQRPQRVNFISIFPAHFGTTTARRPSTWKWYRRGKEWSSNGKKNKRVAVVQLMSACVRLWISCTTAKKGQICSFFHCLVKIEKIAMHLRDEEVPRGIQTVDPIWIIQEEAPELVYTLIRPSNVVQFFTLLTLIRIRRVSNNCVGNVGKLKT